MSFYWCVASLKLDVWLVDSTSQRSFPTVTDAIQDGFVRNINDNQESISAQWGKVLLIGKNPSIPILTKRRRWRWLLVTDPYNQPGYIVKLSPTCFDSLRDCTKNATKNVTIPTASTELNEPVVMYRQF
jgi:hypothetical protein